MFKIQKMIVVSGLIFSLNMALAGEPMITLQFSDPSGLCKAATGKTQFSLNYKYSATHGAEYYSGPVFISDPSQTIEIPPPHREEYSYLDFEITDQGPCGEMDLDYFNLGECYHTNLLPADSAKNSSYLITISPQATGNSTYGREMYNLKCSTKIVGT